MKHTIVIFFIIFILSFVSQAWGTTTYYIDCNAANDFGAGTSSAAAWKTLTKVNGTIYNAGDSILFNKGCTWNGVLATSSLGSSVNTITYGAYGSGAKPIIDNQGINNDAVYVSKSYIVFDGLTIKNAASI